MEKLAGFPEELEMIRNNDLDSLFLTSNYNYVLMFILCQAAASYFHSLPVCVYVYA